jgi:hypothetical protein
MATLMTWIGPGLDVVAVVLLAAVLWRLGRDPGAASAVWGEREERLQAIFDDLRALVAQSEGLARDLDAKLARREERLQALLGAAETAARERRPAAADATQTAPLRPDRIEVRDEAGAYDADPAAIATRIEALADAGAAVEEIARRLGVAPAEVRLVIGLKSARAARQRAAAEERASA